MIISVLKLTYEMDPDFVGMVPGQRGQTLIPVARGQPERLLPAETEQVRSQVVAVKDVHNTVSNHHGEANPDEGRIMQV